MLPYAVAIFTSAFLLFQVQPIVARMILPWFGGAANTWTTCMLFFQSVLLAGYAYAHFLFKRLDARRQSRLHIALLLLSLVWLPLGPAQFLKPTGGEEPISRILLTLLATVGLPYFLLSTTGPLLQAWYAREHQAALPYRLFALSNFASLIALVAYPFLFEPVFATRTQGWLWSGGYLLFVGMVGYVAWRGSSHQPAELRVAEENVEEAVPPTLAQKLTWIALAAFPSVLLLAVTNHLTQNVAAIPFLWILPLSIYLLTFVLCFDSDRIYHPLVFRLLLAGTIGYAAYHMWKNLSDSNIRYSVPAYVGGLFLACMFGHGELARRRPAPRYLTSFYLMLSVGGALGGLLISVVAPLTLKGYYELPISLAALALFVLSLVVVDNWKEAIIWVPLAACMIVGAAHEIDNLSDSAFYSTRNFYGVLKVRDTGSREAGDLVRTLIHGTINHGEQYMMGEKKRYCGTYYGPQSGAGVALRMLRTPARPNLNYAVLGLGIGSLSCFAQAGDHVRFYEINPAVPIVARQHFTLLGDSPAKIDIVMGDGRLSLEREPSQQYDFLAADAFSSDSIPVHLITRQAVELYRRHVKPDGIIAIHISNKYLELEPVVRKVAESLGMYAVVVENEEDLDNNVFESDWVLLTQSKATAENHAFASVRKLVKPIDPHFRLWTDDYSNLFQTLK